MVNLYVAYHGNKKVTMQDLENALKTTFPLIKIMGKEITNLRKWAKARTILATEEVPEEIDVKENKKKGIYLFKILHFISFTYNPTFLGNMYFTSPASAKCHNS